MRALPCLLRGRTCQLTRWVGTFPKRQVTEEYKHICIRVAGQSDPHHVQSKGRRGPDVGNLVPLCHGAHRELHQIGQKEFQKRWNLALPVIASTLTGA